MKKNLFCLLFCLISFCIYAAPTSDGHFSAVTGVTFRLSKPKNQTADLYQRCSMNDLIDIDKYNVMFDSNRNYINITNYAVSGEKSAAVEENIFRRMEILFFGSLTIVTFSGWFAFSIFNIIIYGDDFGILRKEQFLPLYLGSSIISLSVSVSDLINSLTKKKKFRYVEFYQR